MSEMDEATRSGAIELAIDAMQEACGCEDCRPALVARIDTLLRLMGHRVIKGAAPITTVESLEALPLGAVVLDINGDPWQRLGNGWTVAGLGTRFAAGAVLDYVPLTPVPALEVLRGTQGAARLCCCEDDGIDRDCYPCNTGSHTGCPEREVPRPVARAAQQLDGAR